MNRDRDFRRLLRNHRLPERRRIEAFIKEHGDREIERLDNLISLQAEDILILSQNPCIIC